MKTIDLAYKAQKKASNDWKNYLIESTIFAKEKLNRTDDLCIANLIKETNCSLDKAKEMFNNIIKYKTL